jgi:hypothetical protein
MTKYIATSATFTGEIVFGYDGEGYLKSIEVSAELTDKQWHWLSKSFPVTLTLLKLLTVQSTLRIQELPADLSFAVFWEAYNHKVGDKKKAEKLWNILPEVDRVAALAGVPKYLYWLATKPTIEQANATTWLNQRRWENVFNNSKK